MAFLYWAWHHHGGTGQRSEYDNLLNCTSEFCELHGSRLVETIMASDLIDARQKMIDRDLSRSYINSRVRRLRRIFRWGVEQGIVPSMVLTSLASVSALRPNDQVRESAGVRAITVDELRTITSQMTDDMIAAMTALAYWTGARPGELVQMHSDEIIKGEEVWEYRPRRHKTMHLGMHRIVYIGPRARATLEPYLTPPPLFSGLITSVQGPLWWRTPNSRWTVNTWGREFRTAARRAGVQGVSLLSLRHGAAQRLRDASGIEAARAVLGHACASTTEIYASESAQLARRVARQLG